MAAYTSAVDPLLVDLLFDPQASGGLLISIDESDAERLLEALMEKGVTESSIVGEMAYGTAGKIFIT